MFKGLNRRVTAGFMAMAVSLSQVLLPLNYAFADSPPELVCTTEVSTGASGKIYDEKGELIFERYIDRWGANTRIGAGTTINLQNARLTVVYSTEPDASMITGGVTPGWGAVADNLRQTYIPSLDTGTIHAGQQGPTVMHNADIISNSHIAANNLVVSVGNMPAGSSFSFNGGPGVESAILTATRDAVCNPVQPAVNDPCGPNNATWLMPADTNDIAWTLNSQSELIATAKHSVFQNGLTSLNFGVAPDNRVQCHFEMKKLDQDGNLLPGGVFEALSCTRWANDLNWQCQNLNDFEWMSEMTTVGTTANKFFEDIPMRGGWDYPIDHCVAIREISAPSGYIAYTNPSVVCKGPGGWTVENAMLAFPGGSTPITFTGDIEDPSDDVNVTPAYNQWRVTNDASTGSTVLSLTNYRTPVQTPLTFEKVDQDGKLLPGGQFLGYSCSRFNNDPDWTCVRLNDYEWFHNGLTNSGTTFDNFTNEIDMQGAQVTSCSDTAVQHVVMISETKAPFGYTGVKGWSVFCQTINGWVADGNIIPGTLDIDGDGNRDATNAHALNNVTSDGKTITIKNSIIGNGSVNPSVPPIVRITPQGPKSVAPSPAQLPSAGPSSGANNMAIALLAAVTVYGAVYFAQGRRL